MARRRRGGRNADTRDDEESVVLAAAVAVAHTGAAQPAPRLRLQMEDYAQLPITGELDGQNTRGQLARVNFLRDEPGGRRFFVNDLNGPLYILDKQTKKFTVYLDFNGLGGRPGLFPKFTFERNFATGLTNFLFDPDYARNGVFYTMHMEDPAGAGHAGAEARCGRRPRPGRLHDDAGDSDADGRRQDRARGRADRMDGSQSGQRDLRGHGARADAAAATAAAASAGRDDLQSVARHGDPDWRVMYIGAGDSGSGDQRDSRRINPQRLDTLVGKILRIVPDLREHAATSTVSENGRYRIPNDNPFATLDGARKEIWAYGLRNPHRLIWDVDPARPKEPRLLAFHIGLVSWETVVVIRKGANYGWPLREGTQARSLEGMGPIPPDDTIPIQISDTVESGAITPTYPVLQYPHRPGGGDAIANGFIYRGSQVPALRGKLVFGDITTGRMWYAERADLLAADDGDPATVAPIHEIDTGLRGSGGPRPTARAAARAQSSPAPPRSPVVGAWTCGSPSDDSGELYVLTKADGMIRKVVGAEVTTAAAVPASAPPPTAPGDRSGPDLTRLQAAALKNPVPATPASIAAGKAVYDATCAACHGDRAQGAVKAKLAISIIEEQGGKQPPDLTDDQWDHGSSDGEIYAVTKRGVPSTMMPGFDGAISDDDVWNIVNYLRTLVPKK